MPLVRMLLAPLLLIALASPAWAERVRLASGKQLDATCAAFPQEYSEWFRPLAAYAADNLLNDGKSDDPVCALRGLEDLPTADIDSRDGWLAVAELLLTRKGEWRKTVTRNQGNWADLIR